MPFRGLLGVHSRFGLPVRSITQGDLYQSTSTHVVTSLRRSGCFRPSDRLAGWDSHPLEIADFHGVLSIRHGVVISDRSPSVTFQPRHESLVQCVERRNSMQHDRGPEHGELIPAGNREFRWEVESHEPHVDEVMIWPPASYRQAFGE